jgi:cell division protein FtsL
MKSWQYFRVIGLTLLFLVNFFTIINYINQIFAVQDNLSSLEKKISEEQNKQVSFKNNLQTSINEEIRKKQKDGEAQKIDPNKTTKLQDLIVSSEDKKTP